MSDRILGPVAFFLPISDYTFLGFLHEKTDFISGSDMCRSICLRADAGQSDFSPLPIITKQHKIMKSFIRGVLFSLSIAVVAGCGHADQQLLSPEGKVVVEVSDDAGNGVGLRISYADGASIARAIDFCNLGMSFGDTIPAQYHIISGNILPEPFVADYRMVSGKRSLCSNVATQALYDMEDKAGHKLGLRVLAFDNGVAFRYEAHSLGGVTVGVETTQFAVPDGACRWFSEFDYNLSYERLYPMQKHAEARHYGYPALMQASNACFVLLSESGVERYNAASSIYNYNGDTLYNIRQDKNQSVISGDFITPWRVAMVGPLSGIVESNLVFDVAPACRIGDTSWIKPGVASWIYWAYNHGSRDFQIVSQYIHMAASMGLPYVLIDAEWDEMDNGGNIHDAIHLADSLGVGTLIWYNSSTAWVSNGAPGPFYRLNKPEDREKEFAWLERMGVKGVKIDFFQGDSQETMQYCIDLLESAARHHLMVNFHGATIPRGWQRTYPNLMTTEAVRGAEWYNNGPDFTEPAAAHNATLPFTRNVIGSMDYTPCTFSDSQFPHITTNAHELALTVVFESAIQHLADRPGSYFAQPRAVQDFLGSLPSTWDETRLLEGYPGDYAVVARRKGNIWYIGCINGASVDRIVNLDFSQLGASFVKYTIFDDGDQDSQGWRISTSTALPSSIRCLKRGGFVIVAQ